MTNYCLVFMLKDVSSVNLRKSYRTFYHFKNHVTPHFNGLINKKLLIRHIIGYNKWLN